MFRDHKASWCSEAKPYPGEYTVKVLKCQVVFYDNTIGVVYVLFFG